MFCFVLLLCVGCEGKMVTNDAEKGEEEEVA
jgi:hypothetical protein